MKAIYAFSGDPITYGHVDIVERAARTYEQVVVGIGENPRKSGRYTFSRDQRLAMARRALKHLPNVSCEVFGGLLAEYAYRHGIDVIVRGVRNGSDLESELVQFAVNESLHPTLDTVFLPTRHTLAHISSSVVKAIVVEGGDVSSYCPMPVKEALERRLLGRYAVGIAGGIASGKSHLSQELADALNQSGHPATLVNLDQIGHDVLGVSTYPAYAKTRQRIADVFGGELLLPDGSIDRRALGRIVFADAVALETLNGLMRDPMLARLYQKTRSATGILLIEGAILVEGGWSRLVNHNVILVDAPDPLRIARLCERDGVDESEARQKIDRQLSPQERLKLLRSHIDSADWGHIWEVSGDPSARPAAGAGSWRALVDDIVRQAQLPTDQTLNQ